jgi:ketosteroid isomerase-like protein
MPISDAWLQVRLKHATHRSLLRQIVMADEVLSARGFVQVLTEDASFRFGGAPPTVGKATIEKQVTAFFATVRTLRHDIELVLEQPNLLAYEARVTYTMPDGRTLSLPYANMLRLRGPLIHDYRIYIDPAPLIQG